MPIEFFNLKINIYLNISLGEASLEDQLNDTSLSNDVSDQWSSIYT